MLKKLTVELICSGFYPRLKGQGWMNEKSTHGQKSRLEFEIASKFSFQTEKVINVELGGQQNSPWWKSIEQHQTNWENSPVQTWKDLCKRNVRVKCLASRFVRETQIDANGYKKELPSRSGNKIQGRFHGSAGPPKKNKQEKRDKRGSQLRMISRFWTNKCRN